MRTVGSLNIIAMKKMLDKTKKDMARWGRLYPTAALAPVWAVFYATNVLRLPDSARAGALPVGVDKSQDFFIVVGELQGQSKPLEVASWKKGRERR